MNHPPPPKVLVAPLDWGLGHATRCIPIIEGLIGQGCTVVLAGDDRVEALLKKEFPALKFVHLSGYKINYATTGWKLPLKIVAQIPKLLSAIKAENEWLKKIVREEKIEAVISDNRYGLYHPNIVSVFVTHQLRIKAPVPFIEALLQKLNYSYIHRFHFCWVPDEKEKGLAGELSHPKQLPAIPLTYLGALSRLKKEAATGKNLLIILSGPEPQRSILEEKLVRDLAEYQEPVVLVRGLPGANGKLKVNEKVKVYNHLTARELQVEINAAKYIISRCGYSTVMDLAVLQKKSILIPTPAQTEQEYLAHHLMKNNFALCIPQKKFRLKAALDLASLFPYVLPVTEKNNLQEAIRVLLGEIGNRGRLE